MVKLHSHDNMTLVYRTCPAMGKLESSKLLHKRGNESHMAYSTAYPCTSLGCVSRRERKGGIRFPYRRPENLASIPGREGHRWRFHLAPYPENSPVRKQAQDM